MIKILLMCVITLSTLTNASAQHNTDKEFNNFVEGALTVYSQFKTPSKAESERFYSFVQSKWVQSNCKNNCSSDGQNAGSEYAKQKNIQMKQQPS